MRLLRGPSTVTVQVDWFDLGAHVLFGIGMLCAISGCAFDVSYVERVPTTFQATASEEHSWTLQQDQSIGIGSGFPTKLRQGTRWQLAGRTPRGDVYRTSDQIVTVEASNIFEAMVVMKGNKLTGFYLPVDHSFVAATEQVTLSIPRSTQQ